MSDSQRFQKAEEDYFRLKGRFSMGRITREQFEAALQELVFQDEQGRYWMLGTESGKWHVFDGTNWVQSEPPVVPPSPPQPQTPTVNTSPIPLSFPPVAPQPAVPNPALPPNPPPPAAGPPPAAPSYPTFQPAPPPPFQQYGAPPPYSPAYPGYPPPAPTFAPPVAPRARRGPNCCVTSCLVGLILVLCVAGAGAAFYFHVPQQLGLLGATAESVYVTVPDRAAASDLKEELTKKGISTQGMDIYVLPFKDKPGNAAYVVLDASHGFKFSGNSKDPILDYLKQLANGQTAQKYDLERVAVEYKGASGESLMNLTVPTDAIAAFANGSLSRDAFLKKVDGQANWTSLYQELFK